MTKPWRHFIAMSLFALSEFLVGKWENMEENMSSDSESSFVAPVGYPGGLNFRIPRNSRPPKIYCHRSPAVDIIYIINYIYKNHEYTSFFHPLRDCGPR